MGPLRAQMDGLRQHAGIYTLEGRTLKQESTKISQKDVSLEVNFWAATENASSAF